MVSRRRFTLALAALAGVGIAFKSVTADEPASDDASRQAVVVYGDRDNGFALATLLTEVGLKCRPASYPSVTSDWTADADVVVVASCCPGGFNLDTVWSKSLLDRLGEARVLACGNTGASLLSTKNLLIGHPNGAHWPNRPIGIAYQDGPAESLAQRMWESPHRITPGTDDRTAMGIQAQQAENTVSHVGIYDGGSFPDCVAGIARISGEKHHWLICQQGNYTLWGADCRAADMADNGRKLLANLAWHLAHAAPVRLVFPEKRYVEGIRRAKLIGGGRDEVYYALNRVGRLKVHLEWEGDATMMLMVHGPVVNRVDGKSPLEIALPVTQNIVGDDLEIEVGSFELAEGVECPFELSVDLATD